MIQLLDFDFDIAPATLRRGALERNASKDSDLLVAQALMVSGCVPYEQLPKGIQIICSQKKRQLGSTMDRGSFN